MHTSKYIRNNSVVLGYDNAIVTQLKRIFFKLGLSLSFQNTYLSGGKNPISMSNFTVKSDGSWAYGNCRSISADIDIKQESVEDSPYYRWVSFKISPVRASMTPKEFYNIVKMAYQMVDLQNK